MTNYAAALAAQFHKRTANGKASLSLSDAGNTIPFIARYRKRGSTDRSMTRPSASVYERLQYLRNLDTRKAEVRELIEGTGNLTPEIEKSLTNAQRWQRSTIFTARSAQSVKRVPAWAKERGLEPLAKKNSGAGKGVLTR